MYYVLFNYSKGKREKDFLVFRTESDVIEFLHAKYKEVEVYRIIEASGSYKLGLIVTEDFIKSTLKPDVHLGIVPEEPEKTKEKEEEEIIQQNKVALERAEKAIEAGKKDLGKGSIKTKKMSLEEQERKKDWKICPVCNVNKMAPWNTKGRCSSCQQSKKIKKKEEING